MTIRFAGPCPAQAPHLRPHLGRDAIDCPANDNGAPANDAMLHAALRHFAEHGLAAAQRARRQAESAFFAGDRQGYAWWLEVCRTLDRRLAAAVDVSSAGEALGKP